MLNLEGIDHVALSVKNVASSVSWYRTVLGFDRRHADAWGDYPAMIGIGTTCIALFPIGKEDPTPTTHEKSIRMLHLAFRAGREQFELAQQELRQHGIAFEFQDHDIAHSIYFEDPDGHRLEITTYDI